MTHAITREVFYQYEKTLEEIAQTLHEHAELYIKMTGELPVQFAQTRSTLLRLSAATSERANEILKFVQRADHAFSSVSSQSHDENLKI